ncbi:toll/interleukin-1 receptor domain-containing protein [Labrys okinawensis]|uniref:toll/interleukin-1 receptor domain-containing protein n=1 Tax=Labrys okinawensis TaxID=346911 RepID=UPI0039BCF9BD
MTPQIAHHPDGDIGPIARTPKAVADADTKTSAFISYHHNDVHTARVLLDELQGLAQRGKGRDHLNIFLDIESVPPGALWKPTIDDGLRSHDWLLVIYSGEQSDYVGYEVGTFEQFHDKKTEKGKAFITCIYDVDPKLIPATLTEKQNVAVPLLPETLPDHHSLSEADANELFTGALGTLLQNICKYKALYVPDNEPNPADYRTAINQAAINIAQAFMVSRGSELKSQTSLQPGIEISFKNASQPITAIPEDAEVMGTSVSFSLFDLTLPWSENQAPKTTWSEFGKLIGNGTTTQWMRKIESDVVRAIQYRGISSGDVSFLGADKKTYRPILVRHQLFYNGSRKFFVIFVETPNRRFAGNERSSLLLTGLILASRWRFIYLENWKFTLESVFGESCPPEVFEDSCKQLLYNIDWIENESVELGASDQDALVAAFGIENKARTERFFTDWQAAKADLLKGLAAIGPRNSDEKRKQARQVIMTFLERSRSQNADFLHLCITQYSKQLLSELGHVV